MIALEKYFHTYWAGFCGFVLSCLTTISAPQFVGALTPLLGNHAWALTIVHGCTLLGVILALNGKGLFSKAAQ